MKRIALGILLFLSTMSLHAQLSPWEPMNRGLLHTLVYTIEIDPVDSLRMYCGTDYGNLYTSTDGGFNWSLITEGIPTTYSNERVTALFLDKNNTNELYAGFGGRQSADNLFRSSNRGQLWTAIVTPEDWKYRGVLHVLKTGTSPSRLVCGLGHAYGIFVSSDEGKSWEHRLTQQGIQVIAAHPANPHLLFAGSAAFHAMHRSTDGGLNWSGVQSGLPDPTQSGVRAITFSPSDPATIYAGVTGTGRGLYRSTDAGQHWSRLNEVSEISEIAVYPDDERVLYISAIGTGVWRSRDGGATWVRASEGLPTGNIMRVRIAPGYPVRVFALTLDHAIFRMVDEEL
ncbi:MAG: hypothetical protein M5R41_11195 [Bacteroidia bacterium]|nr:hypothetical protein [Bacteroidia bacterium]